MVEEDDVGVESGVEVDGGSPEGVGVRALPGCHGGEDGGDCAAESFFGPAAIEVLEEGAGGVKAVLKGEAGDGDSLLCGWSAVIGEEEVEELAIAIEDDGEVAVAAGEEAVGGVAIERIAGSEDEAQIGDGSSAIEGDGGADDGGGEAVAGAKALGFVVIPEQEGAIVVAPDGFEPGREGKGRREGDGEAGIERELAGARVDDGESVGMEKVKEGTGPEGRAVGIDGGGKFQTFRRQKADCLGGCGKGGEEGEESGKTVGPHLVLKPRGAVKDAAKGGGMDGGRE